MKDAEKLNPQIADLAKYRSFKYVVAFSAQFYTLTLSVSKSKNLKINELYRNSLTVFLAWVASAVNSTLRTLMEKNI